MLTQQEADDLICMKKRFVTPRNISLPPGADQTHELIGEDNREQFLLDLWRGTLRLSKVRYQTRGRKVFVLVRLEINGPPHTNPDGKKIGPTHLHVYREGYEGKWAYPLDPNLFQNPNDVGTAFSDFCRYCNIESEGIHYQERLI
jgi:hypothetical protein